VNGLRPEVERLKIYAVDQDGSLVKLNQNEAPDDVPPDAKEEAFERLRRSAWNRYPAGGPGDLEAMISAREGHPAEGILAGNGSNELIQTLLIAACDRGDRIVTVRPTFSVYGRVAGVLSLSVDEVPLADGFAAFDTDALIERSKGARMVILASPNNPTGTALTEEDGRRLAGGTEGLLVIDEAYFEFSGISLKGLIAEHGNVVVLRTLSKAWRLAGARLGYLMGRESLVHGLAKAKLPFSVGLFARTVAEVVFRRRGEVDETVRKILNERERVFQALSGIPGISPVPSSANFILFGIEDRSASVLFEQLRARGVLVRVFDDPLLAGHLRVTIGKAVENDAFLEAVRAVASGVRS
jgi:histidinol-phosphate aminotransferase